MSATAQGPEPDTPRQIGRYQILRVLGEGSMGRVYLAREENPPRDVALKLLRSALLPARFENRFRREIELLGRLEHPGIARLYAAGSLDNLPYMAMEYVAGADLRSHASALDAAGKLRLLAEIARGVHYAHTRGVVHRDLKPGNILVDGSGQPKILDFGVAHVMEDEDQTQMTVAGQVLGTLPYMAPEQLGGGQVDPRSDVYALGCIAYELLSGALPHPGLSTSSLMAAAETVRKQSPQRLSRLAPGCAGDIETIVHKALAFEPSQRYQSAAELAADIERFLAHQPIAARPPTVSYVVSLFVRRHKALAAGAALAVTAIIGGAAVSLSFALEARARLQEREAVNGFLVQMLTAADPRHALGAKLTVLDVVNAASQQLDADRALSPRAVAQLRRALGNTFVAVGSAEKGTAQLRSAQGLLENSGDEDERRSLELDIGAALKEGGKDAEAKKLLEDLLAELGAPADAPGRQLRARVQIELADVHLRVGEPEAAETLLRSALEVLPADGSFTLLAQDRLAFALHLLGRYEEALTLSRSVAAELRKTLGAEHPQVQEVNEVTALNLRELARHDEAIALYRETLAARERVMGPDHPMTHITRSGLAAVLTTKGELPEALALARQAHAGLLRQIGADAEMTRQVASNRAYAAALSGELTEAVDINRALIAQTERKTGGPSQTDLPDYNNLGAQLMQLKRFEEACGILSSLLGHTRRMLGDEHPYFGMFQNNYGECLRQRGQLSEARAELEHSRKVLEATLDPEHPHRKRVVDRLRQVYAALGLKAEAAGLPQAP